MPTSGPVYGCCLLSLFLVSNTCAKELEYNRDIRPILAEQCFACHGPDSAARKADLRLDQRDAAIDMASIVPGDPEDSELIRRIMSDDPDELMPPPETKKSLTPEQKQLLATWIKQGAEYELHWSFIAPTRPVVPDVPEHAAWVRNPIDHFVVAKFVEQGLRPAQQADRQTLARRLSLDLTGLPPTPQQVAALVNDTSPRAYERYVDSLLESEHWGEHRGRYWLDYARYADTHGIHFDNFREMWSYRDWVIQSFNHNMPFDQFTIENLAGDLLPGASLDQQIGSGFNRCNMTTNEGGIIDEEYLVLYTRDRVETTSQVWLGLTAGCAVCHSHKFDPLSQREFYEMAAFFNNSTQGARDGNIKDTPPIIPVPRTEDRRPWDELKRATSKVESDLADRRIAARADFEEWLQTAKHDSVGMPTDAVYLRARFNEGKGKITHIELDGKQHEAKLSDTTEWQDGLVGKALKVQGAATELPTAANFERTQPFTCAAWVKLYPNDSFGAICARMDNDNKFRGWDLWSQRRQIGLHLISDWPDNGLKVVAKAQAPANRWVHVAVTYDGSGKAAGVKVYYDGQRQETNVENNSLSGPTTTDVPFRIGQRSKGEAFTGGIQALSIFRHALSSSEVEALAKATEFATILAKPADQRSSKERDQLYAFWLDRYDEDYRALTAKQAELEQQRERLKARGTIAHVMQDKDGPASAFVLFRGEYDERRDEVSPATPAVLPKFPEQYPANRLGFAQWLLLPEQPLTARVTVNRFWQEVFGRGMVGTAGDFGVMGELPSHPELLDWLAVEFRDSGWDVKQLFRLIVTSATYRQSAVASADKIARDPANRYLCRGPRFRMDAEMVRDYALASSGLLVPKIGGPSVKPYQPPGVWEAIAMNVSNTRQYVRGKGDDLYRRSIYTFVKRMAPPASMEIFNAPNREYCVVQRERTNTPLQALVTLNDEQFIEAARQLAQLAIKTGGDDSSRRLNTLSQRLVARTFRPEEQALIRTSLSELDRYYRDHPEDATKLIAYGDSNVDETIDAPTLAAWTMLANELMNLDEVLCK